MYKTYRFKGQDPAINQVKTMFLEADMKMAHLSRDSRVSTSTMRNWFNGTTMRPQNATIEAAGRALGFQREWVQTVAKPYWRGKNGNER